MDKATDNAGVDGGAVSSELEETLSMIDRSGRQAVDAVVAGHPLCTSRSFEALVQVAIAASPARLDTQGATLAMRRALDAGATQGQIVDVLAIDSVIGLHALTEGMPALARILHDLGAPTADLNERDVALREEKIGSDPYWANFESHMPGFFDGLLKLSPGLFRAFFSLAAVPWTTRHLSAKEIELLYIAIDSSPDHAYEPGLRIHLSNALTRGALPLEILDVLALAAAGDNTTLAFTAACLLDSITLPKEWHE